MQFGRQALASIGTACALALAACSPGGDPDELPALMVETPPPVPDEPAEPDMQPASDYISDEEKFGVGEAMAENLCQGCHAIGATGSSPHPSAPAFRDLSKLLDLESLREPMSNGVVVNHPDMPEWAFEPRHVESIMYYLESVQSPE